MEDLPSSLCIFQTKRQSIFYFYCDAIGKPIGGLSLALRNGYSDAHIRLTLVNLNHVDSTILNLLMNATLYVQLRVGSGMDDGPTIRNCQCWLVLH